MTKRHFRLLMVLLLMAFVSSGAIAGVNRWTTHGPAGPPSVAQLVTDPANPSFVYAATSGGVFKSEDGADSWLAVNDGLTDRSISALALRHEHAAGSCGVDERG